MNGRADTDVLKLVQLRKVYQSNRKNFKVAVQDLTFGIPQVAMTSRSALCIKGLQGETFGFLGVNGAGKSTTMSILVGQQFQTSGKAFICSMDTTKKRIEINERIGYCPQHDALLDLLTVTKLKIICHLIGHMAGKGAFGAVRPNQMHPDFYP